MDDVLAWRESEVAAAQAQADAWREARLEDCPEGATGSDPEDDDDRDVRYDPDRVSETGCAVAPAAPLAALALVPLLAVARRRA